MRVAKQRGSWLYLQFTGKNLSATTSRKSRFCSTLKNFVQKRPFEITKDNHAISLNTFSSIHYSTNAKFATEPTSSIRAVGIPKSIEDLKSKTYDEVNELFIKTLMVDEEDLKKFCLKGIHLYGFAKEYEAILLCNGTTQTARETMLDNLMLNHNVTRKAALIITDWLIQLIYNDTDIMRNQYKLLGEECKSVYVDIHKKLQNATSESEKVLIMQDGKESISTLRHSFYETWDNLFNKSTLPLLDASIFNGITAENLISMTSIRNDSAAKKLYQQFYKEPADTTQQIPLPVVKNSIKIQYLALLDNTTSNQTYFNYKPKSFSIAVAPSGCGKTHEILKYGHVKYCLFFNGSLPGDSDSLQPKTNEYGFNDVSVAYLESICNLYRRDLKAKNFVNNFIVEYFTSVLILSRLVYLDLLKTTFQSKLTPTIFLLSQLNENSIAALRVFQQLLRAKLKYKFVLKIISDLQQKYQVFAVLDEANVLTNIAIATRIVSYNFSDEKSPLLASISKTLVDNIDHVVFAGTTLEVTSAVTRISAIGKELEHTLYFPAKFKRTKDEIMEVFNQVINIDGCESIIEKYSSYLYGSRIRLFMKIVALLPQHLKEGLSKSTQFEEATIDAILKIRNDIKLAIQEKYNNSSQLERSTIIHTLVEYFVQFTTIGYYEKNSQEIEIDLVNLAICELVSKNTSNQPSHLYSSDRVSLEAVALFLLEQQKCSEIVSKFSSMLKSFDNNQSPKEFTIEMFFASMLCLRYFASRCFTETEFHVGDIQPAALINWIPSTLHSKLKSDARIWLNNTNCKAFIVKQYQSGKDFVDNMQPNTIHIVNNASSPNIFLYNDELILTFALKSAKDMLESLIENANTDTLNISKIIASNSTHVDYLDEFNKQAIKKIGDSQLRRYQLKISILVENATEKFKSSVECTDKEIFVNISSSDVILLFPQSLRQPIAYLTNLLDKRF